jgi:hypothetical protein
VAVSVYVRSWVGGDETEAISALKDMAGQYASYPSYRRQFDEMGLGPQASVAGQAHRAGRHEDVPEVLVRTVCAVGEQGAGAGRGVPGRRRGPADRLPRRHGRRRGLGQGDPAGARAVVRKGCDRPVRSYTTIYKAGTVEMGKRGD